MGSVYLRIISFLYNIKIEINIEYSSSTSGRSEMPLFSSPKKHNKSPPLLWILNVFISTTFDLFLFIKQPD